MKKTLNEVCRPIYEWKGLGQAVRSIYWSNTFDAVFFAEFASLLWLTQWKLGFFHLENRFCIANSSLEITGTQSKFCEYRESYGDINEDDQSCFSICSHIQSVNFSDLHSKLHSQCHFQICAKNRVLRYLGERFPGRMCCAFRGSPPELCPISVHVRYGIRMLSVSAFHRCAGRYGTAHWYVRGTEAKMTRRKKIEFKDLRTPTTKGYIIYGVLDLDLDLWMDL